MLADELRAVAGGLAVGRAAGSRALLARLVVEIEAVGVEPEEGVGNRFQHGAVLGVGDAQARDGVAGAQHVQHAVAQDRPVDRLGHEIGGARLVGVGHGFQVVAAGDHHHRHAGAVAFGLADGGAGREAVHSRHVDVHQHQVRHARLRQRHRLDAVGRLDRVQPDLGQHLEHQEAHHRIVVGDQHRPALGGSRMGHVRIPFLAGHAATGVRTGIRAPRRTAGGRRRRHRRRARGLRARGTGWPGARRRRWRCST